MNSTLLEPAVQIFDLNQIRPISFVCLKPAPRKIDKRNRCQTMNSVNNLVFLVNPAREIIGDDFVCSMCAVGRHQFATCNPALLMGGNTRVGLEGNFYLEKDARGQKQRRAGGKQYSYR